MTGESLRFIPIQIFYDISDRIALNLLPRAV